MDNAKTRSTSAYSNLLWALFEKNVLNEEMLLFLEKAEEVVNPFLVFDLPLTSQDELALRRVFARIPPEIDWSEVQFVVAELLAKVVAGSMNRKKTRRETQDLPHCHGLVDLRTLRERVRPSLPTLSYNLLLAGPPPPHAGRYTVASRFRCRSCERGYIFQGLQNSSLPPSSAL